MNTRIRLLLADDHAIVRMGLRTVFELEGDLEVIAEAATADEAVAAHASSRPDVTLLDLRMPGGGLEALRRILGNSPRSRVLVVTTSDLEEDIHRALAAGASGYVLKSIAPEELADAIRGVHAGARWVPAEVARKLADRAATPELSPREMEVLHLVVKGLTNPEIADALDISLGTAKAHLRAILAKLQVADRTEAASEALRRGLID
ncbi:MAG: response regulator transcription factor [Verrucomicrobiales bacterium]|nr:response regulator transcription factor [Verrucomicrobiae bacterium]MCP5555049.1 response regulator transcription factor [Akkermansiaceae bacterium]HRX55205.1 response regulator transcription factor [Verrucomicrobiales bacterium]